MSEPKPARMIPPIYALLALLAMYFLDRYLPLVRIFGKSWRAFAVFLTVAGGIVSLLAIGAFTSAGTPIRPFEPSTALVTSGIYRLTRNPMYLGLVLVLIGVALLWGSAGVWLPIPLFVVWVESQFIRPEEQFLTRIFGERYLAYRKQVRRWL
jgi:protein-S-isoprenylcysteine O-methyltransferase Ste14